MRSCLLAAVAACVLLNLESTAAAENAARPLREPALEAPTLHSLGVWWTVGGDDNTNAAVDTGQVLRGLNDRYRSRAPDLGAYELGDAFPHYGPRPSRTAPRQDTTQ